MSFARLIIKPSYYTCTCEFDLYTCTCKSLCRLLQWLIGDVLSCSKRQPRSIGLFNNQAYHNPAISLGAVINALFGYVMNSSDVIIETINHPLPVSRGQDIGNDIILSFQSTCAPPRPLLQRPLVGWQ